MSRISCSVTSQASSSATYKLLGRTRCWRTAPNKFAKFMLKLLATGAWVKDFTSSAYDGKSPCRFGRMFVASIVIFPPSPVTLLKASEILEPGASHSGYQVLAHLSEAPAGRLRSFELGRLLRWEKSRLSQHLGRMQTRGLVARQPCNTDQRGAVVAITSQDCELIKAAAPQHVADVRDALIDHLTATELEMLTTIGDKIRERLATLQQNR